MLEELGLSVSPLGDEGIAALVTPPSPAGALPPPTGVLAKLKVLDLGDTQVTDAGCAALAAALDNGALPSLKRLNLYGIPANFEEMVAVYEARPSLEGLESESESEHEGSESEQDEEDEEDEEDEDGDEEDEEDEDEDGQEDDSGS